MSKTTASIISVVFHPLLMPTLLFSILYLFSPILLAPFTSPRLLLMVFISSYVMPLIIILTLYKTGVTKNLMMDDKNERIVPFALISMFYWILTFIFFGEFKSNPLILLIIMSISTTISAVAVINCFWKISAHSAGSAGVLGFLIALTMKHQDTSFLYPLIGSIVIAGTIMSARLSLQIHNLLQVILGCFLGLLISFSFVFFLL